jgi:hypothetical protein
MEPPWNRETCRNLNSNPMAEVHPKFRQICSEKNVPFRQVVEEESPTWLYHSNTFGNPRFAPLKIRCIRFLIIAALAILLAQIERRISENGVDNFVLYAR